MCTQNNHIHPTLQRDWKDGSQQKKNQSVEPCSDHNIDDDNHSKGFCSKTLTWKTTTQQTQARGRLA